MSYGSGDLRQPSRWLPRVTIAAWLAGAIAVILICVDTETVLVTGPIIALLGTWMLVLAIRAQRRDFIALAASHLAICLLFFGLVQWFHWGPQESRAPFALLGAGFVIANGAATLWLTLKRRVARYSVEAREA